MISSILSYTHKSVECLGPTTPLFSSQANAYMALYATDRQSFWLHEVSEKLFSATSLLGRWLRTARNNLK